MVDDRHIKTVNLNSNCLTDRYEMWQNGTYWLYYLYRPFRFRTSKSPRWRTAII